MTIEQIRQQLIEEGINPDDVLVLPNADGTGYQVWQKQYAPDYARFADQQDTPIKEDVDTTAETVVYTAMDVQDLAEMLVYALEEIEALKGGSV